MNPARPLPDPEHPLYGPFWAAATQGRLVVQRCDACGHLRWPPAPRCPECLAAGGAWTGVPGLGTLWGLAVYEHAYHPALRDEIPYACGLVELDAGPRMIARVLEYSPARVDVGTRLGVQFHALPNGLRLPCFVPLDSNM